ncbi:MAG TPA: hypothetical protein VGC65_06420 [Bacteroidia bacterium]|jgi:hypothetical protein
MKIHLYLISGFLFLNQLAVAQDGVRSSKTENNTQEKKTATKADVKNVRVSTKDSTSNSVKNDNPRINAEKTSQNKAVVPKQN